MVYLNKVGNITTSNTLYTGWGIDDEYKVTE